MPTVAQWAAGSHQSALKPKPGGFQHSSLLCRSHHRKEAACWEWWGLGGKESGRRALQCLGNSNALQGNPDRPHHRHRNARCQWLHRASNDRDVISTENSYQVSTHNDLTIPTPRMLLKTRHFSWTITSKNDELGKKEYLPALLVCWYGSFYVRCSYVGVQLTSGLGCTGQVPTFHTRPTLPVPNHCPLPAHLPHHLPLSIWVTDLNSHLLRKALSLLHGSVLFWFPTLPHHLSWQFCGQYPLGLTDSKEPCPQTLPSGGWVYSALPRRPYWAGQHLWPETLKKTHTKKQSDRDEQCQPLVECGKGNIIYSWESWSVSRICRTHNSMWHSQQVTHSGGTWVQIFFYKSEENPEKECKCSYLYRSHFMCKSCLSWKE